MLGQLANYVIITEVIYLRKSLMPLFEKRPIFLCNSDSGLLWYLMEKKICDGNLILLPSKIKIYTFFQHIKPRVMHTLLSYAYTHVALPASTLHCCSNWCKWSPDNVLSA